ncbi:MAG TPA: amidohydrolase [Clostridia bacterium]|nr:amidohydrolase [Clostridia bacterium]HOS17745.1 amidohydrolase [Clostridia bacterium]HPK14936.1 amidohydrolase [Clostridia bacterium]
MNKDNYRLIETLRHELHMHPELSNHETWTKARLMSFLREHTSLELHDGGKWFFAAHREGEGLKNIAFRADFDALPIDDLCELPYRSQIPHVSHKCGHDGHAAALCGLALELEGRTVGKNVFLIFQHAEETGDGAWDARGFVPDNRIDEIYAFHNIVPCELNRVVCCYGTSNYASKGMIIDMTGTPTHASLPEAGRNPAYALANIVAALADIANPAQYQGEVLCTIIQLACGERAFGTAASSGQLLLTIRAEREAELDQLQRRIEDEARAQAERYGLGYAFSFEDSFPETVNDEACVNKVFAAATALGFPYEAKRGSRASEDFGHFLKRAPGALFFIGGGADRPPFHTSYYDFTDSIMESAVEMFKKLIEM